MAPGKGYIVAPYTGGLTATFTGTLNTGTQTISNLTKTELNIVANRGFNLIGNPFASAITWGSNITLSGVSEFAWVWNGGAYLLLLRSAGTGIIPAEQGFFVQVATAPGSVAIASAARVHSAQAFYKSNLSDLFTLKIEGNGYWDQTQVRVLPESSETYNMEYDAVKFSGSEIAPQLFSYKQDVSLSMLSMPAMVTNAIIPLGLQPGAAGNFTITASDMETFESNTEFFLEDLIANKVQDLKINPVYTFDAAPGQPEHRFNLHFASVGMPEGNTAGNVKIYSSEKTVYVNIPSELRGKIVIYNMLGSEIATRTIQSGSLNKISLDVPSGFYLVKVDGDTQTNTGKVFIK